MSETAFTIVTHSGKFHADEVCAVAFLELWKGEKAKIVRSREIDTIEGLSSSEQCFVVDVGLVYDPDRRRYNHHQDDMDLTFEDIVSPEAESSMVKIPLSSFGLVYSTYGRDLLRKWPVTTKDIRLLEQDDHERIFKALYCRMCRDIDAHDNGVSYLHEGCTPRFVPSMMFGFVLSTFNTANHDGSGQDGAFRDAVEYAKVMMHKTIDGIILAALDYRSSTSDLIRHEIPDLELLRTIRSGSRPYMIPESTLVYTTVFRKSFTYWAALDKTDPEREIHFIIVKKEEKGQEKGQWKVNARSVGNFTSLTPLVDESAARNVLGSDLVFVHKENFVGSTKSLASALMLCHLSMEQGMAEARKSSLMWSPDSFVSILAGCALVAMTALLIRQHRA